VPSHFSTGSVVREFTCPQLHTILKLTVQSPPALSVFVTNQG